jgi:hypothetical protein
MCEMVTGQPITMSRYYHSVGRSALILSVAFNPSGSNYPPLAARGGGAAVQNTPTPWGGDVYRSAPSRAQNTRIRTALLTRYPRAMITGDEAARTRSNQREMLTRSSIGPAE